MQKKTLRDVEGELKKAMKLLGRGFMFVKYGRQGRPKERLVKLHEKSAAKLVWTDGKAVKEKREIITLNIIEK